MNTTAQIARLRAEAEELEAQAWDKRVEVCGLADSPSQALIYRRYAVSCREMAASYIQDSEQAERENV